MDKLHKTAWGRIMKILNMFFHPKKRVELIEPLTIKPDELRELAQMILIEESKNKIIQKNERFMDRISEESTFRH